MRDLSVNEIIELIDLAQRIEKKEIRFNLENYLAALLFFEPSTRTMFSFDAAMKRLNGKTEIMTGTASTSVSKGESLRDTIVNIERYVDLIVMRHPLEGSVRYVSEFISKPIINAGDGANQHPTQALLDVYSIFKTQNHRKMEDLTIALVGDLKFGRTVHSLAQALSLFGVKFVFISPDFLKMPETIKRYLKDSKIDFQEMTKIEDCIESIDILYMTRVQKERFADPDEYARARGSYILKPEMLKNVRSNFKIMHPLPRVDEITTDVDLTPYAYYFDQAENGVYMREAIIVKLLGVENEGR